MKLPIAISILTSLVCQLATAAPSSEQIKSVIEAQPYCQNFVRLDQNNVYLGFGPYLLGLPDSIRQRIPSFFRVAPLDGSAPYELKTNDSVIDIVTMGTVAFVLSHSSIEEWDMAKRMRVAEYPTYVTARPLDFKQHAEAMARYKDKLIIAHGRLGISFFDLHTKKITNQFRLVQKQSPLESQAVGITIQGNRAYVAMDNFTLAKPGEINKTFRGIVVINLDTQTVIAELGGMDPGSDSILSDSKKVIVSFMGQPIWKYGIQNLKGSLLPEPEQRVWRFPIKGHPTGSPVMDDKYYYTCYSHHEEVNPNGTVRRRPRALDRRTLMLD